MHFVCASSLQKHLYKNEEHMHLNRRVMRSNYRRFVGRVTDWFEDVETERKETGHARFRFLQNA